MPPRSKAAKNRHKRRDYTDEDLNREPPLMRKKDEAADVARKKAAESAVREEAAAGVSQQHAYDSDESSSSIVVAKGEEEEIVPVPVVPPKAPSRRTKAKANAAVDLAPARQAVDSISDSFGLSAQLSRRLPGSDSPMWFLCFAGVVSEAAAVGGRFLLGRVARAAASGYPSAWATWSAFVHTTAPPGDALLVSGLAIRIAKQVLAGNSRSRTITLAFLTYGPMVFLLSSFYNVPLPAALLSEGLNFAADLTPLLLHHGVYGHVAATRRFIAALSRDPVTFALTSLFAAVLYGFTWVQACGLFLPSTLVVHFANIATVVPARLQTVPSLHAAYEIINMSLPAWALSAVSGVAARIYLFGVGPPFALDSSDARYTRQFAVRTLCLMPVVGLSIFTQCYWGIPGVTATGAGIFSSIWVTSIMLVGGSLGYFVGA